MGRRTVDKRDSYDTLESNRLRASITKQVLTTSPEGTVKSVASGTNLTGGPITVTGTLNVSVTLNGATQIAAGAAAGELWYTVSHATLPDNVVMVGV